jgi:hypothetical protein
MCNSCSRSKRLADDDLSYQAHDKDGIPKALLVVNVIGGFEGRWGWSIVVRGFRATIRMSADRRFRTEKGQERA